MVDDVLLEGQEGGADEEAPEQKNVEGLLRKFVVFGNEHSILLLMGLVLFIVGHDGWC